MKNKLSLRNADTEDPIKLQLDEIVRNIKSDYEVWIKCHSSGWPLVADISKTFGKYLTTLKNLDKLKTSRALRKGRSELQRSRRLLKLPYQRLVFLADRLLDATESTRESLIKLRQMCASNDELAGKMFYRNWQVQDILDFAEHVMRLYDAEYEIKGMVAEEITNSESHDQISAMRQAWREPRHALTTEFKTMFKEFDFETNEINAAGN